LEPAGTDNTVSWLAIRGARVTHRNVARRPTTAELASRSPRDGRTSCNTIFGSDEQIFGAD
jgi:hypothetical protein